MAEPMTKEGRLLRLRVGNDDSAARAVLESNVVAVMVWDQQHGRVVDANELFLTTFGYSQDDIESGAINLESLSTPGYEHLSDRVQRDLETTGRTTPYQRELRRKDGSNIWVMISVAMYDRARGWRVAYLTDLTAQKEAEAEAQRLERRFRALVEKSSDAIVLLDAQFRVLYSSPAIELLLGISPEKWLGEVALDLAHPDELPMLQGFFAQVLASPGRSLPIQTRGVHRDGTIISVDQIVTNLLDDPAVAAIVVNVRDVTAQKRALEELRVSEERNRYIVETTNQGIWIVDVEGKTTFVNRRMAEMLGCPTEEMIGRTSADFIAHADQEQIQIIRAQLRRGENARSEGKLIRLDGTELWIQQETTPLKTESGAFGGSMTMITDLTEARKAETALKRTEEQLHHAQRLEAVGRLAGGVAHDFNNILTIILSYSALAAGDLRPEDPIRAELDEIRKAGERAAALTRQLLAFSRRQILQPRVINLGLLLAQIEQMIERLIGEDVELKTSIDSGLGAVKVDPGQMEQVIMNLVVNARDAMPGGGKLLIELSNVKLDSPLRAGVAAGPLVMLAVTDNGCGMDAATQARIFEPFFTTKELGKGTGLGLSTVFGIVQQSGGYVSVYSEVGIGSSFKVYLPRALDAAEKEPFAATSVESLTGSETIMVVEDDARVRSVTGTILRRLGYDVLEAQGGGDALLIGEQHAGPIHLMVTDVVMPRMNGRQLAERMLSLSPKLKVLYVSGYTDHSVVDHGILDSGIEFLQKPFTPGALGRKVREILDS